MASRICWQCGVLAHHQPADGYVHQVSSSRVYGLLECASCGAASLGYMKTHKASSWWPQMFEDPNTVLSWIPAVGEGKDFPDVPSGIAAAADEAYRCLSIGASRAALLLARRVVESTAKDRGITSGTLVAKIDALCEQEEAPVLIKESAHEIRSIGNEVAHGDLDDDVTQEDANDVLRFMDELLNAIYQQPARLAAYRAQRQARKDGQS